MTSSSPGITIPGDSRTNLPSSRMSLRFLIAGFAVVCISTSSSIARPAGASVDPVRNETPNQTVNPPQTSNPIYYPIATEPNAAGGIAPEALLREFMERHTKMDYAAAAEAAMRLIAAAPDRPEGHYNLACVLSKLHRDNEAIAALDKAIDCGWRELAHTNLDPDLAAIRSSEGFQRIIARMKAAIEAERIMPAPLRVEAWESIAADLTEKTPAIMARYHVPGTTIALVRDGEIVWSKSFGVRDRRVVDSPLKEKDRFRVRAPLQLLALMAGQQQQDLGHVQLAKLLQQGAELEPVVQRDPKRDRSTGTRGGAGQPITIGMDDRSSAAPASKKTDAARSPVYRNGGYTRDTVFGFLRLAIELASNQSFQDYCAANIVGPLKMLHTTFTKPSADAGANTIPLATGHSALGSPMEPDPKSDETMPGGAMYTTADDLATLIEAVMRNSSAQNSIAAPAPPSDDSKNDNAKSDAKSTLELVGEIDALIPGGLGLAIDIHKTAHDGPRVQVADTSSGMGCLMRWHPMNRSGIVILYNSATGREAAERIAHTALGGE